MADWSSFDKASDRALLLAAYHAGQITGAKAWDEFSKRSLWEKEEAFFHYANGVAAHDAAREVMNASEPIRKRLKSTALFMRRRGILSFKTTQWFITLFGVESD